MANVSWIEPKSHYHAIGQVNSSGTMTNAEVSDNHGRIIDRNHTFSSKNEFYQWAKKRAGIA